MNWWRSCGTALISAVIVLVSSAQVVPTVTVNVEKWGKPDSVAVWRVYENRFDNFVEGQDSLNQLYLKQILQWRPDSTWNWTYFIFDSVIGRGDNRKALITVVSRWTVLPTDVFPGGMYMWPDDSTATKYVRYNLRSDSLTGLGQWMSYTTRIYPQWFIPVYSRGRWRTVEYHHLQDSTVTELTFSLIKIVGLDAQSRALLWFHAARKPEYALRWWQR